MKDLGKSIFNMQRFMILQTKLNPQTADQIPDDYAFAWYVNLYPFFSDGGVHEDLEDYFHIKEEQIDYVSKYIDDEWLEGITYTFYELENYFKCRHNPPKGIDRMVLLYILKYIKLYGGFDEAFWNKLLEPTKHPSEAQSIARPFTSNHIYLI